MTEGKHIREWKHEWKHHGMEVSVYGVWSMGMDAPTLDMSLNLSSSENMLDEREFMMTSV